MDVFKSKRFWAAVGALVFIAIGEQSGFTEEQIQYVIAMVATWIAGDSLRGVKNAESK